MSGQFKNLWTCGPKSICIEELSVNALCSKHGLNGATSDETLGVMKKIPTFFPQAH